MKTNDDYEKAKAAGLTQIDRWDEGREHHPESVRMMEFLSAHDDADYGGYFGWKIGGDGDNGETCMFQMDTYFELREIESSKSANSLDEFHALWLKLPASKKQEFSEALYEVVVGQAEFHKSEDGPYIENATLAQRLEALERINANG